MNKNRIFLIIVILLAALAAYFVLNRSSQTISQEDRDFAVQDTSNISRIFMVDKTNNNLLLSRTSACTWLVNDKYPANPPAVNMLLKTLYNIVVSYPVPKAAYDNVIGRLSASAIKVEIYQEVYRIDFLGLKLFPHEKRTKVYYVGDATQNNLGTYMKLEDSDMPFVVTLPGFRGFVASRYTTNEKDWRDHTIFHHAIPSISEVKFEFHDEPEESYTVKNTGSRLEIIPEKTGLPLPAYDTLKLYNMMNAFNSIKYESLLNSIVDSVKRDSIFSSKPYYTITLVDQEMDTVQLLTFHKNSSYNTYDEETKFYVWDRDRMYARLNSEEDILLIQFFVFDKVLRPLNFFMVDEKMM